MTLEQEELIIGFFYDNPNLWNTKDPNYKNKHLRSSKLEELAQKMS